jgi:hypothetical protein
MKEVPGNNFLLYFLICIATKRKTTLQGKGSVRLGPSGLTGSFAQGGH